MSRPTPILKGSVPEDSPVIYGVEQVGEEVSFAETFIRTRMFKGFFEGIKMEVKAPGTIFDGMLVKQSSVKREAGSLGLLTVQTQVGGDDYGDWVTLPADEADLDPVELNPRIERHPIFADLLPAEVELVRVAFESQSLDGRNTAANALGSVTESRRELASKLLDKLRGGQEYYKLFGYRYTWATHYWAAPYVETESLLEQPGGPFESVIASMPFAWLREADKLSLLQNGRVYKLTSSWLGAPTAHWDPDLYSV